MELKWRWLNSPEEIPKEAWNNIFTHKIMKSYEFFKAMQDSNIPNSSFWYLVIYKNDNIIVIIPCFQYKLDIGVLAPPILKQVICFFRYIYSNFLSIKILGIGSLASTCEQHFGITNGLSEYDLFEVKKIITDQIKKKAKETKNKLVFIKEVPQSQLNEIKELLSKDFYFYHSLPQCIIPIFNETVPYPYALRRKERQRYKTIVAKFNNKYYWEMIDDFTDLIPLFEKLYLQTLNRSKNIFEILNKSFFASIKSYLPDNCHMVAIKNKVGKIESLGLIMEDKDSLIPLYMGINYDNTDQDIKTLHMYSIIKAIEIAEEKGKNYVKIGQTSYYPKILSGALVENLYLGFYSYNAIIQFLIKNLFGELFSPTNVQSNAYKKDLIKAIMKKVSADGFDIIN